MVILVLISDTCDTTGKRDYAYDLAGHWTLEVNSNGTECKNEIYAGSRHFVTDAGGTYFDHSDWLGTMRLRNTYTGPTQFETCTSLPFGDALLCPNGDQSTIHFTGKERDSESGLDHFDFRQYGSTLGRWMSPDPSGLAYSDQANPQSLNLYSYALNSPLNFKDPTGLYCEYYGANFGDEQDVEDVDAHSDPSSCGATGGKWFDAVTTVVVNADNSKDLISLAGFYGFAVGSLATGPTMRAASSPPCQVENELAASVDAKLLLGLSAKLGKIDVGANLYKSTVTGDTGGQMSAQAGVVGISADRPTPSGGTITGGAEPAQVVVNLGPFQRNLTTNQSGLMKDKMFKLGGALGIGGELDMNLTTFFQVVKQNQACRQMLASSPQ